MMRDLCLLAFFVLVYVVNSAVSSPASVSCNVRSSLCNTRGIIGGDTTVYRYEPDSYKEYGLYKYIFGGRPYDITLEVTPNSDSRISLVLKAQSIIKFIYKRNGDQYETESVTILDNGIPDEDKIQAQNRIVHVLSNAKNITSEENEAVLVVGNPERSVKFRRLGLNIPVSPMAETNMIGDISGLPIRSSHLQLIPSSYVVNSQKIPIQSGGSSKSPTTTPLRLLLNRVSSNTIVAVLYGSPPVIYYYTYNPNNNMITHIQKHILEQGSDVGVFKGDSVEQNVQAIMNVAEKIIFEKNDIVKFVTSRGQTHVAFGVDATDSSLLSCEEALLKKTVTVAVQPYEYQKGIMNIDVTGGAKDIRYTIQYSPTAGSVTRVTSEMLEFSKDPIHHNKYSTTVTKFCPSEDEVSISMIMFSAISVKNPNPSTLIINSAVGNLTITFQSSGYSSDGAATETTVLYPIPGSYRKNHKSIPLVPEYYTSPITIILENNSDEGKAYIRLMFYIKTTYFIQYQTVDGWVTDIQLVDNEIPSYTNSVLEDVQDKIGDIVSRIQQISFENDGTIQFITDFAATRIALRPISQHGGNAKTTTTTATSYQIIKYSNANLVPPTTPEPYITQALPSVATEESVKIAVKHLSDNVIELDILGDDNGIFEIEYDIQTKKVKRTTVKEIPKHSNPGLPQFYLTNLILTTQSVTISDDESIILNSPKGTLSLKLIPPPNPFHVNRNSYARKLQEGKKEHYGTDDVVFLVADNSYRNKGLARPLFDDTTYPIVIKIEKVVKGSGNSSHTTTNNEQATKEQHISVQVNGVSTAHYTITYDSSTGSVTNVAVGPKSTDVVAHNTFFEPENQIQRVVVDADNIFWTPHGIRITSKNKSAFTAVQRTIGIYTLKPETYFKNGAFEKLFIDGHNLEFPPFPVYLTLSQDNKGNAKAVLRAINQYVVVIHFQTADGWVLHRKLIAQSRIPVTYAQSFVEKRLIEILQTVEQLAFEKDGLLQIIANSGKTRVAFQGPPNHDWIVASATALSVGNNYIGRKQIKPETYMEHGAYINLYLKGPEFPIFIDVNQPYDGCIEVALQVVGVTKYLFEYQEKDGWVTYVAVLGSTESEYAYVTSYKTEIEDRLKNLMLKVQQIAFENDGRIQFITDYAQTRVTFM